MKAYVAPRPFQLGVSHLVGRQGGRQVHKVKRRQFYHFNILDTVLAVLRNKKEFDEVLSEQRSTSNTLQKDIDGSKLRDLDVLPKVADVNDPLSDVTLTIRILVYADDFQVANPLGSKTKIPKITGFYFKILNLNPSGKLRNIFAYAFARSIDVKKFGYERIFIPFANEMVRLIKGNPVVVTLHGRKVTLNFKFVGITGDTLALNEIYNIRTGRAYRFCRCCLINRTNFLVKAAHVSPYRTDFHFSTVQRLVRLNTRGKTAKESILKNYGYTSVKNSILLKLNFSPRNNCIFDRLHDFFEGVSPLIFIQVVRFLIEKDICTVDFLNKRIEAFDFGKIHDTDKPTPNLTRDSITTLTITKLKQNGIQMHCLIRALPFLVLDKLDQYYKSLSDEEERTKVEDIIELISLHLRSIQICSSHSLMSTHLLTLETVISQHNTLYQKLFKVPLINKFHHLMHYAKMIREYGPAIYLETTRFEALHKIFKQRMNISRNFKNVPFTLARFYSFWFCYFFSYPEVKPILESKGCEETQDSVLGPVIHGNSLTFNEIFYQRDMVLCISTENVINGGYPTFGIIKSMRYYQNQLHFTVRLLNTSDYSQDFCAFEVELTSNEQEVTLESLSSKYPFAIWKNCTDNLRNQRNYISIKTVQFT